MSTDYNYDEQGQFFPYFILTILGLILFPLTYSTFAPKQQLGISKTPLIKSRDYHPPQYEAVEGARRRQAKKERRLKRFTTIVLGWTMFAYMWYLIVTTKLTEGKVWDPYEILGVSTSASEKAIKSHYRKLSLKFHPDKTRPSENETLEMLNDRFVELTKAYKALTDEEVRNNYIQYGHPDGKQSFSIGIALPQWIVAEGNTYYVLAVYGVLFGILLPYFVGKWWYGTRRLTKDGVLVESAGRLFKAYQDDMDSSKLVQVLTTGEEMEAVTGGDKEKEWVNGEDAIVEKKLRAAGLPEEEMKSLAKLDGWRRRAVCLLWAYLYRVDLGDEKLENAKLDVVPAAVALNKSFHSICLAFGNVRPLLCSMFLNQHMIQAVAPGQSPLLQLPHFNNVIVEAVENDGGRNHWTVQRLMEIPNDKRKKLCVGKGLLSESEYATAMSFARNMPALRVEAAFFKVTGEKYITPSSLVQFVLKLRVVPPGSTPPPVDQKDLLDEDADEDDVEALLGRKSRWSGSKDGKKESSQGSNKSSGPAKPIGLPLAHSSFYPRDYTPQWHVFLEEPKQGKLVVPPQSITSFDKSTDNFTVVTSKMQFQAPPQPGDFTFMMNLVSDSYIGINTKQQVTLSVSDPSKMEKIVEVDDISEPEEDSIAGQMNVMRGGSSGKRKKKTKGAEDDSDEDEEDESDTEGEVSEQSETDTDTDTDEE